MISDHPSCLDNIPYKHLLEYGDRDNIPMDFLFMMYRTGDMDMDEISRVYSY